MGRGLGVLAARAGTDRVGEVGQHAAVDALAKDIVSTLRSDW